MKSISLQYVPFTSIHPTDPFWAPRLETNRAVTVPHCLDKCRDVGVVANFARAGGMLEGGYFGAPNWDEFLYKAIEAMSYVLMQRYDANLDRQMDDAIAIIASAQEPDGYLYTLRTLQVRSEGAVSDSIRSDAIRWRFLDFYMCGHLIEAAIAHRRATGKHTLWDIALRFVTLIQRTFGPDKRLAVPQHEEIELALMRLYEETGDEGHLEMARFFVDQRGRHEGRELFSANCQDHLPVIDQVKAVGQAPRATYLYSGMADVAYHQPNPAYTRALDALWADVVGKKMYITGGIGSLHENEGFGPPYELPNRTAYTEICAAISFTMWNARMFRLCPDAKYMDVMERTLYNNFAAGVSLSGDRYFYACPPESDGEYAFNLGWFTGDTALPYCERSATRKEWFPCACCPPNLARYMFQVIEFTYALDNKGIYVNLFVDGRAHLSLAGHNVTLTQETRYPWEGAVRITLGLDEPQQFALRVRIPGWARNQPVPSDLYRYLDAEGQEPCLRVNGQPVPIELSGGYAVLNAIWQSGDVIDLNLPLPIRRVVSHPNVAENRDKVALERGPIVYCAEGVDHSGCVLDLALPDDATLRTEHRPDFVGGVTVIEGIAHTHSSSDGGGRPFMAIPYGVWSNRGAGEMVVWLYRDMSSQGGAAP